MNDTVPEPSVIVLVGASGSGKSTLARTWPADYRLELDFYRSLVSGDAGDQEATGDAAALLHQVLVARAARGLTSVVDATSLKIGRVQASGEASVARLVRGVGARSGAVGIAAV
ncbi:AAA family ATPase [Streptomyces sp. NPDC006365]|uniref:AAA family ATPase n=1 Tax=Streptomyces sp. NPDC006365 TaxID=3364744 RepID=UPI0036B80FB0